MCETNLLYTMFSYSDPLAKSVYLAYKSRKNYITRHGAFSDMSCLKQASRAGELLRESLCLKQDFEHGHAAVRQVCIVC